MGGDMYRGVLPTKLVELMAIAVDASCTQLYPRASAGTSSALAQGATIQEIMEVLRLCGALGVDALELGAHPVGGNGQPGDELVYGECLPPT